MTSILHLGMQVGAWIVACSWWSRFAPAIMHLAKVPDLNKLQMDAQPASMPGITVIVPARNEQQAIRATLESLVAQDYFHVQIIAVDDRSTDLTGATMDSIAAFHPERVRVLHIDTLPSGWTGKVHAMANAASQADTPWLLFTDGDVSFAPDALRRALVTAELTQAEHLVVLPTLEINRWDEGMLLSFLQMFALWSVRPWMVPDPKAKRDALGIGAFNMVKRTAYLKVGGFEQIPMEVLEDMRLGRELKLAGCRSRVAFGRDLVRVHWAAGANGIIGVLTKNGFSIFRYHSLLLLLACAWIAVFSIGPFAGLAIAGCRLASSIALLAILAAYLSYPKQSGISAWFFLLSPVAALLLIFALLRSMTTALLHKGVTWRGTFYPLAELRARAGKL